MRGMGDPGQYFFYDAIGLGSIDSGPPRFCSTMEAPKAVKDMEFCQNQSGTLMYETTKAAFANYSRLVVGHAYADKGVDYYIDAIEAAMKENPALTLDYVRSMRPSSDHCGFYPRKEQLPRMAKYGYTISCAPGVVSRSYPWTQNGRYTVPEYQNRIAPIRSAIQAGVRVTLENEAGVSGVNAHSYFYDAIPFLTRKNEYGATVDADEAIDRNTLLKMMTSWAARYVMKEDVVGTLETGKFADFLVMNKDVTTVPVEELGDAIPLMTVVGGKVRMLRDEFAKELGKSAIGQQIEYNNKGRYAGPAE
jgi:predicted amidohydrolase YtcJ